MSGSSRNRRVHPGPRVSAAVTVSIALLLLGAGSRANDDLWKQPIPRVAGAVLPGPSVAPDGLRFDRFEPPPPERPAARPRTSRFFRTHFVPRISGQFQHVIPIAPAPAEVDFADSVLFAAVSETARRGAERGARKAVRDYLLEVTTLERTVEAIKRRKPRGSDGASSDGLRLGLGIAHGLPRIEMRHRNRAGTLRFRVDLQGSVGLEFSQTRRRYSRVFVGFDADDREYDLGCRFSF